MTKFNTKRVAVIPAIAAILTISFVAFSMTSVIAEPANKTTYGETTVGVLAAESGWMPISTATIKTSTPSDLRVSHNQECTIHTGLNLDQFEEQATSSIREDVRLRIITASGEDRIIPAVPGTSDNGEVTLCSRAYNIDTNVLSTVWELCQFVESSDGLDTDACTGDEVYFDSFIRTKQAHSWDWIAMNLGAGTHTVIVEAKLVNELDSVDDGKGKKGKAKDSDDSTVDTLLEIGKRNLIIVEDKLAN